MLLAVVTLPAGTVNRLCGLLASTVIVSYTHLILPEMDIQLAIPNIDFPLLEALAPAVAVLAGNIIAKDGLLIIEQRFFQFHRQTAAELVAMHLDGRDGRDYLDANRIVLVIILHEVAAKVAGIIFDGIADGCLVFQQFMPVLWVSDVYKRQVQVTMEYNGDTPVRITTVVVSVQHKEDTDINKLADLLDEYVFPLAFDGMPADDAEIILNPSGKFVQGGPDADTGLTGRKLMVDTYGTFAPHGGGAFSGKDPTKVDRSGAYMARYIAKNIVATHLATRCQVTLAYAIGQAEPVMVDVNTFGTCDACEDDCLAAAVRKAYDLTPAGIIKQLNLTNPIYKYTAAGGHFGRKDFPWEKVDNMSDFISYIQ